MKTYRWLLVALTPFMGVMLGISLTAALREVPQESIGLNKSEAVSEPVSDQPMQDEAIEPGAKDSEEMKDVSKTPEEAAPAKEPEAAPKPAKQTKKILPGSEGFVAGPDWEFDGFVAGGQDQKIKSMFAVHDLIYLNVGHSQGLRAGERVGIYRRGDKIRDPQSGKFMGFEVKHVGIAEVTDKIDDETCSARVIRNRDGIEIGDLVRREK